MPTLTTSPIPPRAALLLMACLEAFGGTRALHQVRPCMELAAFECLSRHRDESPGALIGLVRAQMPTPAVVEAAAVVRVRERWLACAVRLEVTPGAGWRCSRFALVGP